MSTIHAQSNNGHQIVIYDPNDLMKQEFVCPKCGGHNYGFEGEAEDGSMNRYCNTNRAVCTFKWNSKEDALYFYLKER